MNELVKINENNQVTTDSQTVADRFGKRHSDVLRSIKMLKCSKEFSERNFASAEYLDEQGKPRTCYDMTRDGWMFLVMGFTGEKAAEWKEKFIAAFNRMEATVREIRTLPVDMKAIGGVVKKCVNKALTDFLNNELPAADDDDILRQKYYNVSDKDMAETLQRWYWSRNYDVRQALDRSAQRIEELETKLRMVQKAIS